MMSRAFRFVVPVLVLATGPVACNGCDDPVSTIDGEKTDPVEKGEPRALTYVGADPALVVRNDEIALRFTLKEIESGAPVVGEAIAVEVDGSVVTTNVSAIPTDESGAIEIIVSAGDVLGQATITARAADNDGEMLEDSVVVRVVEDPVAGLTVEVESDARIEVETAFLRVYTGVNPPTCASVMADSTPPNGTFSADFDELPNEENFEGLTTGHRATAYAEGRNENGALVARGCAEAGTLPGGVVTSVTVTLQQDETVFEGDYDVLMHMALGDALPSPYDENVELVTALLSNPGGYALYFVLREIDRASGFTTFVTIDGVESTYRQIEQDPNADNNYPTWYFASEELHQVLLAELGQDYLDMTSVGAGLRDVVTDFEVGGRFAITEEPSGALSINEAWRDVVLYWPLPCDDLDGSIDMACARRPLSLADDDLAPVLADYGAIIDLAPTEDESERFEVVTDPHGLTLRYGALLLAILEQVVFPSLPGDVAAENFGDVLSNLVGCANIAASLSDDPDAQLFIEGACEAGLDIAAEEIENQLLDLQVDATNPELGEEGLSASGTFALVDADHNLETETLEAYAFNVQWFDPLDPEATSDISAPIVGDGRRAWPVCGDDASCGAGRTCQVRGSYLKVAQVELGCAPNVGTLNGGAACNADDACASGLCAPMGVGGALICSETCNSANDCTVGLACTEDGGLISLDPVMDGLGDVGFPACSGF